MNLLRRSRKNTKLSAYSYLFGPYDYKKNAMVPPGTKVIVHKKPSNRLSWGYHGVEGWYVGPTLDHYRCLKRNIPKMHSTIIADIVAFIPTNILFPNADQNTFLQQTVAELLHLLKHKNNLKIPTIIYGDNIRNAISEIADILNRNKK